MSGDPLMFLGLGSFIGFTAFCFILAQLLQWGKERCPQCGDALRLVPDVDKYHCMRCSTWFNRDDIELPELEGVES